MGLPILQAALKNQLQNVANASMSGWLAVSSLICLEEFLLLLFTAGILKEFKIALETLVTETAASIAALEVIVVEVETANSIMSAFIDAVKSAMGAAVAKLSVFPFNNPLFMDCPIVQAIEQKIADAENAIMGSALSPFAKIYKNTLADINWLQYRLIKNEKYLVQLNLKIAALQQSILAWNAIIDAIANQFGI